MSSQLKVPPTIRQPRLRRGEERVAALKQAAAAVFAERGYDAATMTEIAARTPSPIGSLYQFFPTKELLAAALVDDRLADMAAMVAPHKDTVGQSPAAIVDGLFERLTGFIGLHPALLTLADQRGGGPQGPRVRARMRDQLAGPLLEAVPAERASIMAELILVMTGMAVSIGDGGSGDSRAAILAELRLMLGLRVARTDLAATMPTTGDQPIVAQTSKPRRRPAAQSPDAERRRQALKRAIRECGNMNIADLARRAGLPSGNSIYNFLGGRSGSLRIDTVGRLAKALGVSVDSLSGVD